MILQKKYGALLLMIALVAFVTLSCASNQAVVQATAPEAVSPDKMSVEYLIQPGDQLDIKFFYNPELTETVVVRPDGKISLQLVDDVQAANMTPEQLDEDLTRQYAKELRQPVVTVIVRAMAGRPIYVGGEVARQGLATLSSGMTALQAVINAGGFRETADPQSTIVIRKGSDNRPIPIRVDLNAISAGNGGMDFKLQPHDIVYVPKSAIAKANKFVNQYIEELLLFRGVSLGFSYELHADN